MAALFTDLTDPLGMLRQQINERTWGQVRELKVERRNGSIVVVGSTPSYYLKQLVLEAIRETTAKVGLDRVAMDVAVRGGGWSQK